jgi:hypothetical protein
LASTIIKKFSSKTFDSSRNVRKHIRHRCKTTKQYVNYKQMQNWRWTNWHKCRLWYYVHKCAISSFYYTILLWCARHCVLSNNAFFKKLCKWTYHLSIFCVPSIVLSASIILRSWFYFPSVSLLRPYRSRKHRVLQPYHLESRDVYSLYGHQ